MAIDAVAEVEFEAVVFVLQAPHLFVAEGPDEVVEVPVCESYDHGLGKWFEVFDDLQVQLFGELHERGHILPGRACRWKEGLESDREAVLLLLGLRWRVVCSTSLLLCFLTCKYQRMICVSQIVIRMSALKRRKGTKCGSGRLSRFETGRQARQ